MGLRAQGVGFVRVQGEDAETILGFREYRPVQPPPLKRGFDLLDTGHLRHPSASPSGGKTI